MESVKNNFEELKKMLMGSLDILCQTNIGLANRVSELEKRILKLESRLEKLDSGDDTGSKFGKKVETESEEGIVKVIAAEYETEDKLGKEFEADAETKIDVETEADTDTETDIGTEIWSDAVIADGVDTELDPESVEGYREESEGLEGESGAESEAGLEAESEGGPGKEFWEESGMDSIAGAAGIQQIVNEAAKPDWYDWEVDYPAAYVDDVYAAISFNDRYEFIKELFNVTGNLDDAQMLFKETLDVINEMDNFKKVVAYIRDKFPQWDEQSDEVYRFYMSVRRKFNK